MRTRTAGPGDQSWAARPRWAATAARTAPAGLAKATKKASPWVLTSTPPASATARRMIAACSSWTAAYRSPSAWSRRVEPSMSVNRKVTVPVGRSVICCTLCCLSGIENSPPRRTKVLLEGKNAVVYGGAGSVGRAVARAFAGEGARVFLAGRTLATLDEVAAETAEVDALDEPAVDAHADAVAERAGGIDVSFNAIGHGDVHGLPLLEMPFEDFARPITTAMRAQFLTTRAAARHMVRQGSGVIMAVTATTARLAIPEVGGTGVTFDAIESQCRQWACELGRHGVRVLWLQTTGLPEALTDEVQPGYGAGSGDAMTQAELTAWMRRSTMLDRLTTLAEVGTMAAFMASDHAGAVTGVGANLTCGQAPPR